MNLKSKSNNILNLKIFRKPNNSKLYNNKLNITNISKYNFKLKNKWIILKKNLKKTKININKKYKIINKTSFKNEISNTCSKKNITYDNLKFKDTKLNLNKHNFSKKQMISKRNKQQNNHLILDKIINLTNKSVDILNTNKLNLNNLKKNKVSLSYRNKLSVNYLTNCKNNIIKNKLLKAKIYREQIKKNLEFKKEIPLKDLKLKDFSKSKNNIFLNNSFDINLKNWENYYRNNYHMFIHKKINLNFNKINNNEVNSNNFTLKFKKDFDIKDYIENIIDNIISKVVIDTHFKYKFRSTKLSKLKYIKRNRYKYKLKTISKIKGISIVKLEEENIKKSTENASKNYNSLQTFTTFKNSKIINKKKVKKVKNKLKIKKYQTNWIHLIGELNNSIIYENDLKIGYYLYFDVKNKFNENSNEFHNLDNYNNINISIENFVYKIEEDLKAEHIRNKFICYY